MTVASVGQILQELDSQDIALLGHMLKGHFVRPVTARMVEQRGVCDLPGDSVLTFTHPLNDHRSICPGLLRALRPFLVAEALGIPSAHSDGYLVSCPGKKGTTWLIQAAA